MFKYLGEHRVELKRQKDVITCVEVREHPVAVMALGPELVLWLREMAHHIHVSSNYQCN